mgnify:CR=1 FL=1
MDALQVERTGALLQAMRLGAVLMLGIYPEPRIPGLSRSFLAEMLARPPMTATPWLQLRTLNRM